ncbi:hypothetical protein TVAGG3_0321660 [Trichomonas vaginalis G3]|uniref:hypothetical protein n=1 Tax=Trichomonas vaginalis (strain ATCC PRA-98 / G3) TaxID=412133 RepID=UPI0021E5F766|nr:hypothetical protein TVAGG3_0321660 [Trichomonas vaginalis G3]KAI5529339.1 hypothetical protein TVAGG3_0321660 [Trichomonas vaginalis G3]
MYAAQNITPTVLDAMNGNVSEWYNECDNAIRRSEIVPGTYEYTTAVSYGNVGEFGEGSSTTVDIACDRFHIISIDNSFLYVEQDIEIKPSAKLSDRKVAMEFSMSDTNMLQKFSWDIRYILTLT